MQNQFGCSRLIMEEHSMACTEEPARSPGQRRFRENDPVGWSSPVVRLIILTVIALLLGMASARAQVHDGGAEVESWEQYDWDDER